MNLKDKLKNVKNPHAGRKEPLWTGPDGSGDTGGVTQGLLSRFLCCRERFRLLVVEGIKPKEGFSSRMEFGNFWHTAEQALADGGLDPERQVKAYAKTLASQFPFQREDIDHWYRMTLQLFPRYVDYWRRHPDVKNRTPLLEEYPFDVPYQLPSGRKVRLRGKWDSVDLVDKGIWLQENKTKSTINQQALYNQLSSGFDLQTMLYLVALIEWINEQCQDDPGMAEQFSAPVRGVRYNVIRRPAHKSVESAMKKFGDDEEAGRLDEWFLRLRVEIKPKDLERFRRESLDPILEQLWDWWGWVSKTQRSDPFSGISLSTKVTTHPNTLHFRMPHGIYNPLLEGAPTDYDRLVDRNDMTGMERVEVLFPEL